MQAQVINDTTDHISKEAVSDSATSVVPERSILVVVRSGVLAHSVPVALTGRPVAFNQDLKALIPDQTRVVPDYVAYFLRAAEEKILQQGVKKGATVHSLRTGFLEGLQIPLLPISEQHRIVDILSRAEGIIGLQHQAADKIREIIPAFFLDMFGDPATNPKGWPLTDIGSISTFVGSGITPRGGAEIYVSDGPYFIRSQNVLMNRLDLTDAARLPVEIHEEMARTCVRVGDVLLNITGASIGRVCSVDALPGEANVNQHVCIIRLDPSRAVGALVAVMLSLPYLQQLINQIQAGASRQALNYKQVRAIRIPLPPLRLQQVFTDRAREVRSVLAQCEESRQKGGALFQALLAQAFGS